MSSKLLHGFVTQSLGRGALGRMLLAIASVGVKREERNMREHTL